MILDNKALWDTYNALSSENDKHLFLKKHLLSLKPEELFQYLLDDTDSLGINMIDLIAKGDLKEGQSLEIDAALDNVIHSLEKMLPVSKAA
jgi:hypothetical protein